jgi:hypothetical protein
MVFVVGVLAAALLGIGWVLQQRVAVDAQSPDLLSWSLLRRLIGTAIWWAGIGAMAAGQSLSAWALQLGPVTLVEPLLVACLLFAFVTSAALTRHRVRWSEVAGTLLLAGALAAFLTVADPQPSRHALPASPAITIVVFAVTGVAALFVGAARVVGRHAMGVECALLAVAAGAMYGLQDVATRAAIVSVEHRRITDLVTLCWPYVVLGAATVGVLLSQSAFRAGRLDYALPPTTTSQSLTGIALGVGLLGDRLTATSPGLAIESASLLAMIVAAALIGRSPALARGARSSRRLLSARTSRQVSSGA